MPKPTGMGMPAIGMGDILNIKDRLKKVQPQKEPEKKEPKQYTDHNELQAKFNFFKNKEREGKLKCFIIYCKMFYVSFKVLIQHNITA